jgi:tetratricopeptide (TPR) repeat protein
MREVMEIRQRGNALPRSPQADNAGVLFGMSRFQEALAEYTAALATTPDDLLCLYMRGACLIQLKRYQQAQIAFRRLAAGRTDANLARWLAAYCAARAAKPEIDPLEIILPLTAAIKVKNHPATAGWTDPVMPALFVQTERQITASATAVLSVRRLLEKNPHDAEMLVGAAFLAPPDEAVRLLETHREDLQGLVPFQTALLQAYLAAEDEHSDAIVALLHDLAAADPDNGFYPALLAASIGAGRRHGKKGGKKIVPLDETQARALLEAMRRPRFQPYTANIAGACMNTLRAAHVPFAAAITTQMVIHSIHHHKPLGRLALQCAIASQKALDKGDAGRAETLARAAVRLGRMLQTGSDRSRDVIAGAHIEKIGSFQWMRVYLHTGKYPEAASQRTEALTSLLRIQTLNDLASFVGAFVLVPVPEIQEAWYGAAIDGELKLMTRIRAATAKSMPRPPGETPPARQ